MKKLCLSLLLIAAICSGCSKDDNVELEKFDVKADALTVKAGNNVNFDISGNPDQLYFYTGEPGKEYAYHNKVRLDKVQQLELSFDNHNEVANLALFTVQLSTNFNGVYDYKSISEATWVDITNRFSMSPEVPWPGNWKPSGLANLTDIVKSGQPFYIAYKYLVPAIPTGLTPTRRRRISVPKLVTTTELSTVSELANFTSFEWKLVKKNPLITSLSQITASTLVFHITSGSREELEEWAIGKKLVYNEQEVGFDKSIVLKNYAGMAVPSYTYKFQKPGTYQVTFVASNTTSSSSDKVTKSITITVTP